MNSAKNVMYFADGVTELRLGDRVEIRRFLRKPLRGVVCYIPGQCKPHSEMEADGLADWAVSLDDGSVSAWPYLPGRTIKPSITLISRGEPGTRLLTPDTPLE